MVTLCHLQPPASFLDIGCGLGLHIAAFAKRGFIGTGIEIADYTFSCALNLCQAIPNCRILKLRGSEMTWDGEFDLVYALEHTLGFMSPDELIRHLQCMYKAVKDGGWFLLQIPYTLEAEATTLPVHKWGFSDGRYTLVDKCIFEGNIKREKCVIIDPGKNRIDEHFEEQRYYTWKEIIELLNEAGVKQVKTLRDLRGHKAYEGKDAKVFLGRKR